MKKCILFPVVVLVLLLCLCIAACASAAEVRPIPVDHDTVDLGNGEFHLSVRNTDLSKTGGSFIATLYAEDKYDAEQVKALSAGDTVWMYDLPWTVKQVQTHFFEYPLPGYTTYEIFPEEEFEGYLVFQSDSDGTFHAVINDWYVLTLLGSVKISLPLPDKFEYVSVTAGEEDEPVGLDEFMSFLEDPDDPDDPDANIISFDPYNTTCVFENGELVRVTDAYYPWGPRDEFDGFPVPVWKFCHGLRDGLDSAVITAEKTSCLEGPLPVEITAEEAEQIRSLAINGMVTDKANEISVTGGTWIYTFETPGGKHLLSVEMFEGLIVGSDGMYNYR